MGSMGAVLGETAMGNFSIPCPFGCHGSHGNHTSGGWPKGPMAPLCWGGRYTRERLAGVEIFYLGVPHSDPPRMAPLILGVSLVIRYRFLPIFTSHIVDYFLPIVCCRLQSSILLKIRPPEELLHQTCRTFRGEFDSSTLEVSGGSLVIVFEASRQTLENAA